MAKGYAWAFTPQPTKLVKNEKEEIIRKINYYVDTANKLKEKVSRVEVKAGRVYFYELVEQFIPEGCIVLKPLIDGKYLEMPFGRLTLYDPKGEKCTADWQRHNNQWISMYEGNMEDCMNHINQEGSWF